MDVDVVFVPTPPPVVDRMIKLAALRADDVVYDLGCGDGRMAITAARDFGCRAVGVELDPLRVAEARGLARIAGVAELVEIRQADLFDTELSPASVVMLYLLPKINARLRPKLLRELRPGSRVVSQSFDIDGWPPAARSRIEDTEIYLWTIPAP